MSVSTEAHPHVDDYVDDDLEINVGFAVDVESAVNVCIGLGA